MAIIRSLKETDDSEWLRLRQSLWPDFTIKTLRQEMAEITSNPEEQPVLVAERRNGGLCGFVEVSIRTSAPGCTTNRIGYLEA